MNAAWLGLHFNALDDLLTVAGLPRPGHWEIHGPVDPGVIDYCDEPVAWIESDRCLLVAAFPDPTLNYTLMFSVKTYNQFLEEPNERTD